MKAKIRGKTRNRGRDWAEYRRPDVKNVHRGPSKGDDWRCSKASEPWAILFAVTEFLGTGSQVPLLLVIDAI
jgi:hypothetical protein